MGNFVNLKVMGGMMMMSMMMMMMMMIMMMMTRMSRMSLGNLSITIKVMGGIDPEPVDTKSLSEDYPPLHSTKASKT